MFSVSTQTRPSASIDYIKEYARNAYQLGYGIRAIQKDIKLYTGTGYCMMDDLVPWIKHIRPTYSSNLLSNSQRVALFASTFAITPLQIRQTITDLSLRSIPASEISFILSEKELLKNFLATSMNYTTRPDGKTAREYAQRAWKIGYTWTEISRTLTTAAAGKPYVNPLTLKKFCELCKLGSATHPNAATCVPLWAEDERKDFVRSAVKLGIPLEGIVFKLLIIGYDPKVEDEVDVGKVVQGFREEGLI